MTAEALNTLLDDLVIQNGIEVVIEALAQAGINQAQRMEALGHSQPAQEVLAITEALVKIVEVVEDEAPSTAG